MRVVLDTNVIISAIFFRGTPRSIFNKWIENKFELVCSQEIIQEYIEVIENFGKNRDPEISKIAATLIIEKATIIKVKKKEKYSRDPDDDKFINCALEEDVKYLVSGDKDLLVLEKIKSVEILTPASFLLKIKG